MIIRDSHNVPTQLSTALENAYQWPEGVVTIRLNMVITVDGVFSDASGSSTALSFAEDRRLMHYIRSNAEALVVGARTIRAEGWNLPPKGLLVVISATGNLPWASCPDVSRVRTVGPTKNYACDAVAPLLEEGATRILVEGGQVVARNFAKENLLDEVCLTINANAGQLSAGETQSAFENLLQVPASTFDEVSRIPAADGASVFILWRRALGRPVRPPH